MVGHRSFSLLVELGLLIRRYVTCRVHRYAKLVYCQRRVQTTQIRQVFSLFIGGVPRRCRRR